MRGNFVGRRGHPIMGVVRTKILAMSLFVGLSAAGPAVCLAQRILTVESRRTTTGSEVLVRGEVWLRLRAAGHESQAALLARSLSDLLLGGLGPGDVQVKPAAGGSYELRAKGKVLVVIGGREAVAQKSTAAGLAGRWAKYLRDFVAAPYVALGPVDELQVPVGESRALRVGGTATSVLSAAVEPPDLATAAHQKNAVVVVALRAGVGRLILSTSTDSVAVPLRARYWAARVPATLSVNLTAPLRPEEWREAVKIALSCAIQAQPQADVRIDFAQLGCNDGTVGVKATAPDCLPVETAVRVESAAAGQRLVLPRRVWVSNYPERVRHSGVLLRDRLGRKEAIRLLWHHVNNAADTLWFCVRLWNLSCEDATFAWSAAVSGPGRDEIYLGHLAARAHLDLLNRGAAVVASLRPRSFVDLGSVRAQPHQIISGIAAISLLGGGPLVVEVVASAAPGLFGSRSIDAAEPALSRLCRFDFPGFAEMSVPFAVGERWQFVRIGQIATANEDGEVLHGSYGVLHWVDVQLSNPTTERAVVELAAHAPAGAARMVLLLDGQLLETPLLGRATYHVIHRWVLEAGETRRTTITTMPQAGSNYPVALILRTARG